MDQIAFTGECLTSPGLIDMIQYIYIYICKYTRVYIYINIHIYKYIYIYIYVYIYIYIHICIYLADGLRRRLTKWTRWQDLGLLHRQTAMWKSPPRPYLAKSVLKEVLRMSTPSQSRHLILYIGDSKG